VTHPQQYTQPQMPGYPPAPAQPQMTGYPQAPQQYVPAQPQYGPAQGYGQAQQPNGQPYGQPQQPAPQLAAGSLDAFYNQPSSGGGAALRFEVGTRYVGIVTRPITNADIQQQTMPGNGQPAFFKDGRPKFVMKVPLQMQPTPDRPDGLGQWYVSGAARDELVRAMADAGAPEGPPEAGAVIDITCTGTRPAGVGMNPAKIYQVRYQRPNGAQPAVQPAAQPAAQPAPQPAVQSAAAAAQQASAQTQQVPAQAQQPLQQAAVAPPAPPAPGPATDLSPAQQALLAQLTGQTAA
jgi:hypothetical protein